MLRNLILQHIALGHGVAVIDPHGDLAEELLNHIPPKRSDHLVYFNPGGLEFPIGLNVIGSVAPDIPIETKKSHQASGCNNRAVALFPCA